MGVSTSLKFARFSKKEELIKRYDLDVRADEFIYNLLNDGGSTFNPEYFGEFSDAEKEIMKIYYDKNSISVAEGYAKITQNIQSPKELKSIWIKIRSSIIKSFNSKMRDYHNGISDDVSGLVEYINKYNETLDKQKIFSKKEKVELPNMTTHIMSKYNFDRTLFNVIWSIDCISQILSLLDTSINDDMLVEITAADC